jgi:tRNA pseudouridine38-40 synthase
MAVVRIDLAYDGTGFHGFARQRGLRTVQGELESVLERVLGQPVETTCAGRTDAGVHARHQVVSFSWPHLDDPEGLRRSLRGLLGPEVAIRSVGEAEEGFDARFSPVGRHYRYFVDSSDAPDPLTRHWVWAVGEELDLEAMNAASAGLVGTHDFASFCRRREGATTEREVLAAAWVVRSPLLVFEVSARAFCHQMVRSMTGLCIDVGLGRVPAGSVGEVLAARDRNAVGTVAPPHGLVLWQVSFD